LVGRNYFSFLDGFSGYSQIQLALEDQDKTTFTCPWGTYAHPFLPFGLCIAPTTFKRVALAIFADLTTSCINIYMDDFTVHTKTYKKALESLNKVFQRYKDHRLSLNHEKCSFMMTKGIVLGNHISKEGIKVDPKKVEIIENIEILKNQIGFHSFLGHVGYYRRLIKGFSKIFEPLFTLLKKDEEFLWTINCQKSFETIKHELTTSPIIKGHVWEVPFHIHMDASNFEIGTILGPKDENDAMYVVNYISKNLNHVERNYTTIEK
jgi:hypothetical protein